MNELLWKTVSLPVILTMESSRAPARSGHWAIQVLQGCCFSKRATSWDPGFVTVSETPRSLLCVVSLSEN